MPFFFLYDINFLFNPPLPRRRGDYYIEEYIALCQSIDDFFRLTSDGDVSLNVIASDETGRSLERDLGLFPHLAHNLTSRLSLVDETNAGSPVLQLDKSVKLSRDTYAQVLMIRVASSCE